MSFIGRLNLKVSRQLKLTAALMLPESGMQVVTIASPNQLLALKDEITSCKCI